MRKLRAGPIQGLLGDLLVGTVVKSTYEPRSTLEVRQDTGHAANVFHGASRGNDPEHEVDLLARYPARDYSVERWQVLGVHKVPNHLHCDLGRGIELEDAVGLLGPGVVVRYYVCDKAARLAQPLGFGETKVGLLNLRLRPLSILD